MTSPSTGRPDRSPRVVVWGNGVPAGLERELTAALPGADLTVERCPARFAHEAVTRYERAVRAASPDVVVLAFGEHEAASWTARLRRLWADARGVRDRVRAVARLLAVVLAGLLQGSRPGSTRRFERSVGHLVRLSRLDLGSHVVLLAPAGQGAGPYTTALRDVADAWDAGVEVAAAPDAAVRRVARLCPAGAAARDPAQDPLSVVVLGNSVSVLMIPPRRDRAQGTYGERLVDALWRAGRPARLALEGRWFDFARRAQRQTAGRLVRHDPDVVILHFGTNEAQPWLVPVPLLRHLLATDRATTPVADWYRSGPSARMWNLVRTYRRHASRVVGTRTWQTSPRRFAAAMDDLVGHARRLGALVLVVDLTPPGTTLDHFLPGQVERHRRMSDELRDVVARRRDRDVRLVDAPGVVAGLGAESSLRDGIHLSPDAHAAIADLLAAEVLAWLDRPTSSA